MKRSLLCLLLALCMVCGLCGCGGETPVSADTTTAAPDTTTPPPAAFDIVADGKTEYTIVRGDAAGEGDVNEAIRLRSAIMDATGADIMLGTDWVKRGEQVPAAGREIVIGDTNRPQSIEARTTLLRERDFTVFFEGERIVITGGSDATTEQAVDYFIENCIDKANKKIVMEEGFSYISRYAYPIENVKLGGIDLREYTLVIPAEPTRYEKYAAEAFNDFLQAEAGFTLPIIDDKAEAAAHELVIGATSRAASKAFDAVKPGEGEYLLSSEGGSIVARGESYMVGGGLGVLAEQIRAGKNSDIALPTGDAPAKFAFKEARNMLLLIGDGMGYNQINAALGNGLDEFAARLLPNQGEAKTYSASSAITDSAASGTALSSGYKTANRHLGVDPKGVSHPNIREVALAKGARTAVVTTDVITGATPAAFTVHVADRGSTEEIKAEQAKIEIDYMAGSVGDKLLDDSRAAFRTISGGEESFFIMIEEGYIDKNAHSNKGPEMISAVKRLNEVASYAIEFLFLHPDTALIVTADHETGGVQMEADNIGYRFTSTDHTGANVPVSAYGPGTEFFADKTVNNIEIAKFMGKIWGEENLGG